MSDDTRVIFTSLHKEGSVPVWAIKLGAGRSTFIKASTSSGNPKVIVIREKSPKSYIAQGSFLLKTVSDLSTRSPSSRIVADVGQDDYDLDTITSVMHAFPPKYGNRLDLAFGSSQLRAAVLNALAKVELERSLPDPLGEVRKVAAVTKDLRNDEGRLSADLVAGVFGISDAELARHLGKTRQALHKNPATGLMQRALRPYERIARIRAALSQTEFMAWLGRPIRDLDDMTPLDAIASGHAEAVADYAEDALLGTPS
jgi:hypothetical protein